MGPAAGTIGSSVVPLVMRTVSAGARERGSALGQPMDVDLVVAHGDVVDGTGAARFRADIGVRDGRVVAVRRPQDGEPRGSATVDASGLVVTPGFVDTNTHADWAVTMPGADQLLSPMLLQGVTTVVGGGCGFSPAPVEPARLAVLEGLSQPLRPEGHEFGWVSFGEFVDACARRPLLVNVALMVGQQALRCAVAGTRPGPLSTAELAKMRGLAQAALDAGAVGVSANTGFVPGVYAGRHELRMLAEESAAAGGVFAAHARAYTRLSPAYPPLPWPEHHVRAVRELIAVARDTGVRMQVSHLGMVGRRTWQSAPTLLREIDRAAAAGADVGFDVVPYPLGVGPMQMVFPPWAVSGLARGELGTWARLRLGVLSRLQARLVGVGFGDVQLMGHVPPDLKPLQGLDFVAIATRLGVTPLAAQLEIARRTRLGAAVAVHTFSGDEHDDTPLRLLLAHPRCAVVSNAAVTSGGEPNPAAHGAFPRLLGRYTRELRLFSLEEAVRRATSLPADRVGLPDVGRIGEGQRADLLVIDPATVADGGWRRHPGGVPAGIHAVLVGGQVAARDSHVDPAVRVGRMLSRTAMRA